MLTADKAEPNDFIKVGKHYWLVALVVYDSYRNTRRPVCFRDGVRKTFAESSVALVVPRVDSRNNKLRTHGKI